MWQFNLASYLLLISGMVSVTTAIFVAAKPSFHGKMPMMLMLILGAEWCIAAGFEAAAPDIATKIFWSQIEYIGSMSSPVLYCYFVLAFLEKDKEVVKRLSWILWIIPALTVLIGATNSHHSLLWTNFEWESTVYNSLSYSHGPWFWVAVLYAFLLIILGGIFMIREVVKFPTFFHRQAWYLIAGSVFPIITTIIYTSGYSPLGGFDISPIGFLFAGLLFVFGIAHKQMFDLLPITYHVILENMVSGVLVLDKKMRILDLNPSAMELLKMSNKAVGKIALNEIPELSSFLEKITPGKHQRAEIFSQESEQWLEVNYTPVKERNAKIQGSLIMLRNITSQKRYERKLTELNAQLSESERKLRELNAQKDKLFSVIAHDLKNPFNALLGFSKILEDDSLSMNIEEITRISGIIHKAAQQGYDLLLNLLEWSRLQTKRIDFQPLPIAIPALLSKAIASMNTVAQEKEIEIRLLNLPEASVMADKHMIETVLRNLLSNAIKFSFRKGEILVFAECEKSGCKIGIQDKGKGMTEEEISKLFRLDSLNTTKGTEGEQGSGLGLILCKDFVEQNKGQIQIESTLGSGSTFYFTLPYADSPITYSTSA